MVPGYRAILWKMDVVIPAAPQCGTRPGQFKMVAHLRPVVAAQHCKKPEGARAWFPFINRLIFVYTFDVTHRLHAFPGFISFLFLAVAPDQKSHCKQDQKARQQENKYKCCEKQGGIHLSVGLRHRNLPEVLKTSSAIELEKAAFIHSSSKSEFFRLTLLPDLLYTDLDSGIILLGQIELVRWREHAGSRPKFHSEMTLF